MWSWVGWHTHQDSSLVVADVKLVAVKVNGEALPAEAYELEPKGLTIKSPPEGERCTAFPPVVCAAHSLREQMQYPVKSPGCPITA